MPSIFPSQILAAIDNLFGPTQTEMYSGEPTALKRTDVHALLLLLDELPRELLDLPFLEHLEFIRCRAVLATALARWNAGDGTPARDVGGKNPIECIRRLMKQCHDKLPPPEPELPFVTDQDTRLGIENRIHAAWTDFNAREWMGATVFAGAALEALLLWALKQSDAALPGGDDKGKSRKSLDQLHLADLIVEAGKNGLINDDSLSQARLAKDARNLVHPGKVALTGVSCSKATALAALAGVYRVIDDLKQRLASSAANP